MSTKLTMPCAAEPDDPRQTFEAAISQLEQREPLSPSQQPIFARRPAVGSDPSSEKRVVADAARALARLWKVSSVPVR
jgi:hypothetical protein